MWGLIPGSTAAQGVPPEPPPRRKERLLHAAMTVLIVAVAFGGHYDARYHINEGWGHHSFFAPSHRPLIGAYVAVVLVLGAYLASYYRSGVPLLARLPYGYNTSLLGVVVFAAGGALHFLWHDLFGFEANLEAVFSPAHLMLLAASSLLALGVLRHGLYRLRSAGSRLPTLREALPVILAWAFLLRVTMFFTWYTDPLTADYAAGGAMVGHLEAFQHVDFAGPTGEIAGTLGILLNTMIFIPFVLVALYRWRLPVGTVTLLTSFYVLLKAFGTGTYVYGLAFLLGAAVGDLLWARLRQRGAAALAAPDGYRAIAVAVPWVQYGSYFAVVSLVTPGVIWPLHLWLGIVILAGAAGLFLSYAVVPPAAGSAWPDAHTAQTARVP